MNPISSEVYDEIVRVWNEDPAAIYDAYEINEIRKEFKFDLDLDSFDTEEYSPKQHLYFPNQSFVTPP